MRSCWKNKDTPPATGENSRGTKFCASAVALMHDSSSQWLVWTQENVCKVLSSECRVRQQDRGWEAEECCIAVVFMHSLQQGSRRTHVCAFATVLMHDSSSKWRVLTREHSWNRLSFESSVWQGRGWGVEECYCIVVGLWIDSWSPSRTPRRASSEENGTGTAEAESESFLPACIVESVNRVRLAGC